MSREKGGHREGGAGEEGIISALAARWEQHAHTTRTHWSSFAFCTYTLISIAWFSSSFSLIRSSASISSSSVRTCCFVMSKNVCIVSRSSWQRFRRFSCASRSAPSRFRISCSSSGCKFFTSSTACGKMCTRSAIGPPPPFAFFPPFFFPFFFFPIEEEE
mgnify:CR=1 FL=1